MQHVCVQWPQEEADMCACLHFLDLVAHMIDHQPDLVEPRMNMLLQQVWKMLHRLLPLHENVLRQPAEQVISTSLTS